MFCIQKIPPPLTDLLLNDLETSTNHLAKAEIMKELEFSRFVDSLYEDRDLLIKQIQEEIYKRCQKAGTFTMPIEILTAELQSILGTIEEYSSETEMTTKQQLACEIIAQIMVSIWVKKQPSNIKT